MFNWPTYLQGLYCLLAFGFAGWIISVIRSNVTHVDSMWSLFFVIALLVYIDAAPITTNRTMLVLALIVIWAVRLCIYLTKRNWSPHEDHRYVEIRKNNPPFWIKSLYIVFILQALLAWIISLPLLGISHSLNPFNWLDYAGLALWLIGFTWEVVGDAQLKNFKAKKANAGKVLNTGLWRYSRHPNYFGECCTWWAYYLMAVAAGAWWSFPAPVLMTLLLLKVSGIALLEKDIAERRPAYLDYIKTTPAFIPWLPKKSAKEQTC